MPKCQRCAMPLQNCNGGDRLKITDTETLQCIHCFSTHSWATGKLLRTGGEKK